MCRILKIPRSLTYYKRKSIVVNTKLENEVISIFIDSKNNYGSRKIKVELEKKEIIGYSTGCNKDFTLVYDAFMIKNINLGKITIFHTDRGNEFKNKVLDDVLKALGIEHSLSNKGCPYDNAVAGATYKVLKTEFVGDRKFDSIENLRKELRDYVLLYNYKLIHSSLNYITPVKYRLLYVTE